MRKQQFPKNQEKNYETFIRKKGLKSSCSLLSSKVTLLHFEGNNNITHRLYI